jgi:Choline dehydrogenase and related flavoproteins
LAAAKEMGYNVGQDLNGNSQLGFSIAQATNVHGRRISLYNAYVEPIVRKRNLFINTHSYVSSFTKYNIKRINTD